MFMHIVLMNFVPGTDEPFHSTVQAYCERITKECSNVLGYTYGPNLATRNDGLTHAVVASFEDSEAHDAYQISSAHQEMKAFMSPAIQRIVVFDGLSQIQLAHASSQ